MKHNNEMHAIIDDYFTDCDAIAQMMIAWCTPTKELMTKIKRYENRAKAWKKLKRKKFDEVSLKKDKSGYW